MEQKKIKVLLVDDDRFLLDMYALKFTNSGMDVSTFNNAEDVLVKLREKKDLPDIIILDVIMPGMSGLDLLENIRKENLIPSTVVVVLTNQSQTTDIERAKSLKADGYIVKASTIPSEVVSETLKIFEKNKK